MIDAPTLSVTGTTTTTATLDWDDITGAVEYDVYDSSGNFIATVSSSEFTDTGLTPDTSYSYYVVAVGADIDSAHSNTVTATTASDSTAPTATGSVSATNPTTTTMDLDWPDASDDITAAGDLVYDAYYSLSDNISSIADIASNGTLIGTTTGVSQITATSLTPGTTYYFNVVVTDEAGNESVYTRGTNTTLITAPTLSVTGTTTTTATLDWNDITGAVNYTVYDSSNNPVATVTDSTYTVTGLTPGTSQDYYVVANGAGGSTSPDSNTATATTTIDAPTLSVTDTTTTTASLDWNNVDGATGYTVYDGSGTPIATITGNDPADSEYIVTGLTPSTSYDYYVVANGTDDDSAYSNTVTATTKDELISINVTPESAIIQVGGTQPLTVEFNPDTAVEPITWTTSNSTVATVDTNGVVTGLEVGRAVITATAASGASDTSIIEVQSAAADDPDAEKILVEGDLFYVTDETPIPDVDITLYSTPLRGTTDAAGYFYLGYGTEGSHTLIAESSHGTEIGRIPVTLTKGVSETYTLNPDGSLDITYNDGTERIFIRLMIPRPSTIVVARDVVFISGSSSSGDTGEVVNPNTGDEMNFLQTILYNIKEFFRSLFNGQNNK